MAQKRKESYGISFKSNAVESAKKKSKEAAAPEFGVRVEGVEVNAVNKCQS